MSDTLKQKVINSLTRLLDDGYVCGTLENDPVDYVCTRAAITLGKYGSDAESAIPKLREIINDGSNYSLI